jgi:HYR domain-containing protein/beta-propeller uncharacterized protein DUF5122
MEMVARCCLLALLPSLSAVTSAAQAGDCPASWLPTFGTSAGVGNVVQAQAVFDDGSGAALYVGGGFTSAGGLPVHRIARWDGARWSTLGSGLDDDVLALEVFDDGSGAALYAAGSFTEAGGAAAAHVARWDGVAWSSLGSGMSGFDSDTLVTCLEVYDDGSGAALYAGGQFLTAGGVTATNIARWDGTSWAPLGSGILGGGSRPRVSSLAVFDGGGGPALFAGGEFNSAGGVAAERIARWDGESWSPLGTGLSQRCYALLAFDDGSGAALYAAGGAPNVSLWLSRWDGSSWTQVGSGVSGRVLSLAEHDDGSGPALYAAGDLTQAGGVPVSRIARWDGSSWSALGSGMSGSVVSMQVFDDGSGAGAELVAGGLFASSGNMQLGNLARWNGASWTPLASGLNDEVFALGTFDDGGGPALYAGGSFTHAGREPVAFLGRWDGTSWSTVGGGPNGSVRSFLTYDDGGGPALYVGGTFTSVGGTPANRIARWDGASWSALGTGLGSGSVQSMAVFDDGGGPALYVSGNFTQAGGALANRVARWDGVSWSSLGSGAANGTNNEVRALAVFDDGSGPVLYAGGVFSTAGGAPALNVARWNGTSWAPLVNGTGNVVSALAAFDDGNGPALYVGGQFSNASGVPASGIARWDGASWAALGNGQGGGVSALLVLDDGGGPALVAGGSLLDMGGVPAKHLARWDGTSWSPFGNGTNNSVLALASLDDGSGAGPALFAGGDFTLVPDSGDGYLGRWQAPLDETPPVIACPTALVVPDAFTGPPGETVFFTVTAADECDPAPALVCVPPSGSFFPRGTTLVTCTATDAAGNESTCDFPVTVQPKARRR